MSGATAVLKSCTWHRSSISCRGHCRSGVRTTRCREVPPTAHRHRDQECIWENNIPFSGGDIGKPPSGVTDAGTAMRHGSKP